ncbi:sporulation inhibitor KapD [Bacillus coahuilensis p1.1.43]|uniref:Sporulation inhibitor KapD n=1 Tax=Bacillus coahuilensis p1.1.43 TaxID=1150625 RepID=A0A147K676_9BACI|nr:3'-5' exonuclease KapD [Bacillus coahuilensis]KUP05344.1 sporulation inhibitor KapD [Bacillus coahuilensis p1.1.43]
MDVHQHIFLDFEFSMPDRKMSQRGFFPEIIEVGVVVEEDGSIIESFSSYVQPRVFKTLTPRCKKFLKIKQEDVDGGISFIEFIHYLQKLNKKGKNRIITWGNMDMKVLRENCEKAGLLFPFQGEFVDLSLEYKRFFGDRNQTGLWKAVEEYGKDGVGKHHKALDDAMTTYNIYKLVEKDKEYLNRATPPTIGDRVDMKKLMNLLA